MFEKSVAAIVNSSGTAKERHIGGVMPIEPSHLLFTPTTMATMESTLSAFENELTQSSDFSDDDSSQDWQEYQQQPASHFSSSGQGNTTRRLPGPKSSIRTEDMTPEEIRRRDRRRERNKLAAARCRQRRLDITNQLLAETQKLEAEAQKLEREIENLRKQKTQLQFVLDAHQPTCCGNVPPLKMETGDVESDCSSSLPQAMRPSSLSISGQLATTTCQSSFDFGLGSTGFTPIVSSSGVGVFLGTGSDIVSPTALLLSPMTMTV